MTGSDYAAMYNANVARRPQGRSTSVMTGVDASGNPYQTTTDSGDPEVARKNQADEAFRAQRYSDTQRALAELSSGGTGGYTPTDVVLPTYGGGGDAGYEGVDAATRTGAKEQRGLALQGALKALASQMNARGIGGSGSEGAGIARLVTGSHMAGEDTERGILAGRAERAQHINDLTYGAGVDAAMANAGARNAAASQSAAQRLQALLTLYGMSY